ncbi:helix-turn-helix domain-containing protein [Chitinophaga agri]|uniref:Helix-turn-helix domain-containing protein n=1 Tax=Chitinophaga agri TaxID=2703787 RepID=A0A6B9ZQP7_9BACT|nr:helix-turn-helix domain-containing protein [Chitinophaga agri]QHS63473.1 helix-turn-helix domain-containing protein [Chitinophaga agri]
MGIIKTSPLFLAKYVQCFYSVIANECDNTIHRRLPDGTLDLVFNLGKGVSLSRDEVQFHHMPAVSLTGLYPDRSFICYADKVHLVGIVFQPGTAHLFIKDSLEHIKASTVDAADIFGKDIYLLLEQLTGLSSEADKHYFLEKLLMKYVAQRSHEYHLDNILHAVKDIHMAEGNLDISVLHHTHLMSERNFRRKFVDFVGMSPKQYAGIIRIKAFSKRYKSSHLNYNNILYDLGYNDQAHFNKDFMKIVGSSPGLYFNEMNPLAENFLHLI